jgi:hypothetical protein
MPHEELQKLIESNARAAQAMLDSMVDARHERKELRQGMIQLQGSVTRFENVVDRLTTF